MQMHRNIGISVNLSTHTFLYLSGIFADRYASSYNIHCVKPHTNLTSRQLVDDSPTAIIILQISEIA